MTSSSYCVDHLDIVENVEGKAYCADLVELHSACCQGRLAAFPARLVQYYPKMCVGCVDVATSMVLVGEVADSKHWLVQGQPMSNQVAYERKAGGYLLELLLAVPVNTHAQPR